MRSDPSEQERPVGAEADQDDQHRRTMQEQEAKLQRLRSLELFVLDNSLRETNVAALRGHTLQDKIKILQEVQACGLGSNVIVGTFAGLKQVEDVFCRHLRSSGFDMTKAYAFSEASDGTEPDTGAPIRALPLGLARMKKYGIPNPIIELNLAHDDPLCVWANASGQDICDVLLSRFKWAKENLSPDARMFVNIRDFYKAFKSSYERVQTVARFVSSLPPDLRPLGLMFEEPTGEAFPFEIAPMVSRLRYWMDSSGWRDGHLLLHAHHGYGMAQAVVIECLASGATGIWCAICDEGAATGHAGSLITLTNLARIGNKWAQSQVDLRRMREAAINITRVVTGSDPAPRTEVYGARALDCVFSPTGMGGGAFDPATLFSIDAPVRVTTLATDDMIIKRLTQVFGDNGGRGWSPKLAHAMYELLHLDLISGKSEEYTSPLGLASLYERAGGEVTPEMQGVLLRAGEGESHPLIQEVRHFWDEWDATEGLADGRLTYDSFYHGFLGRYLSCASCPTTEMAMHMLDISGSGSIAWPEMLIRLKWALAEYGQQIQTAEQLIAAVFERLIIPELMYRLANGQGPPATRSASRQLQAGSDRSGSTPSPGTDRSATPTERGAAAAESTGPTTTSPGQQEPDSSNTTSSGNASSAHEASTPAATTSPGAPSQQVPAEGPLTPGSPSSHSSSPAEPSDSPASMSPTGSGSVSSAGSGSVTGSVTGAGSVTGGGASSSSRRSSGSHSSPASPPQLSRFSLPETQEEESRVRRLRDILDRAVAAHEHGDKAAAAESARELEEAFGWCARTRSTLFRFESKASGLLSEGSTHLKAAPSSE